MIKGSQPILALTVMSNPPQFTNVEILYTPKKDSREVVNGYRLYNKVSMQHLYTADLTEYKTLPKLQKIGYKKGLILKSTRTQMQQQRLSIISIILNQASTC